MRQIIAVYILCLGNLRQIELVGIILIYIAYDSAYSVYLKHIVGYLVLKGSAGQIQSEAPEIGIKIRY